jgi:hypothetical protein
VNKVFKGFQVALELPEHRELGDFLGLLDLLVLLELQV